MIELKSSLILLFLLQGTPGKSQSNIPTEQSTCTKLQSELSEVKNELAEMKALLLDVNDGLSHLRSDFIRDCKQMYWLVGGTDTVVDIYPIGYPSAGSASVLCDMSTGSGGWTVIQNRFDGSENFFRGWDDYVRGFGDPNGEHWAGLDLIHHLTKDGRKKLRIELEDKEGNKASAIYNKFTVGPASTNYKLTIGGFNAIMGHMLDDFSSNNGAEFSTPDADHDDIRINCAETTASSWWHTGCSSTNLNGDYFAEHGVKAIYWGSFKGYRGLRTTRMMVK